MRPSVSTPSTSQVSEGARAARARQRISGSHQTILRAEEVVQVQRADEAAAAVDHKQLRHLGGASIVSTQSIARRRRLDRARRARHHVGDRCRATSRDALETAAQVAVGEDAGDACRRRRTTAVMPMPLRLISTIASASVAASAPTTGRSLAGAHDVAHARQELAAERAAGMRAREILGRESARIEQRQRQRVAERQRRGRARRGREAERAGFVASTRGVEMDVGRLRERALLVAGDRDERARPARFRCGDQLHELVGLAGVRQHDDDVVAA